MNFTITDNEKKLLLKIAREAIEGKIAGRNGNNQILGHLPDTFKERYGAFVTLHKKGTLRGCIGHLMGISPLYITIDEMAQAAAFEDPRFMPIKSEELGDINIEISILSPMEKISSLDEIIVGQHGIYLKKGGYSGTLLPQVAPEQGWDRETLFKQCCIKAGLPPSALPDGDIDVFIYSAVVFRE